MVLSHPERHAIMKARSYRKSLLLSLIIIQWFMMRSSFSQRQMYDVVKDVRSYPTFLPYCLDAVVSSSRELANRDLLMLATLTVGVSPFKMSYESKVTCRPYEFVKVILPSLHSP